MSPDAPFILQATMAVHIGAGSAGLVAGAVAAAARKGDTLHRRSGTVFFVAMLGMGALAIPLAVAGGMPLIAMAGPFAIYLTATAWAAARTPPGQVGRFQRTSFWTACAMAAVFGLLAAVGAASPSGGVDGFSPILPLVFGTVMALGALGDRKVLREGGLTGKPRLRRHIWRICTAFFVATGSFFLGQQKGMPEAIQGSPVLTILGLAPLGLMAWWMFRTRDRRPRAALA